MVKRLLVLIILFSVLVILGIFAKTIFFPSKALCGQCNIILISFSSFGAKHSSVYDPTLDTTPFLKELAEARGIVFENAYTQALWASPSQAAILTGQYPWDLNMWNFSDALPIEASSIAEKLHFAGYRTGAFSTGPFIGPKWQFNQGFDEFQSLPLKKDWDDIPKIFDDASAWIQEQRNDIKPFFLFLRPFALHDPYSAPETADALNIDGIVTANMKPGGATLEDATVFREAYRKELRAADDALRDFFKKLDEMELSANTMVVIVGSNGIEFGEHGIAGLNFNTAYLEVIHVPFIVVIPNQKPQRLSQSVETRSIPATILEVLGINIETGKMGASLIPLLTGKEKKDRMALTRALYDKGNFVTIKSVHENTNQTTNRPAILTKKLQADSDSYIASALLGPWHLLTTRGKKLELYNVYDDPQEKSNLIYKEFSLSVTDQAALQKLREALTVFTP